MANRGIAKAQRRGSRRRGNSAADTRTAVTASESELFIGLVGAVGTDLERATRELSNSFTSVRCQSAVIHVIDLLREFPRWRELPSTPVDKRYHALMTAGNDFRERLARGDALALLSIGAVKENRLKLTGKPDRPPPRQAYILRSLKNPAEVSTLRRIYGSAFWSVSVYSPRDKRFDLLRKKIAASYPSHQAPLKIDAATEALIERDKSEGGKELGQNVQAAFPSGDVFIDASDTNQMRTSVQRFVELLFRNPYQTPNRDEYGMFHAQASALRSSDLGRQVGAAIASQSGEIIALGTNEVPKAGGGTYWPGDTPDERDFQWGYDTSDKMRRSVLSDILERFTQAGWLAKRLKGKDIESLAEEALTEGTASLMRGARFLDLIEYGRAVHAEMSALLDASRRGVSVEGSSLYTTTFPCHDCARHIVASGISRVVYIEPYAKSKASELHKDSIVIDRYLPGTPSETSKKVRFEPFVGIAPRRYMHLFTMEPDERKTKDGSTVEWKGAQKAPRIIESFASYYPNEEIAHKDLLRALIRTGLK